MVKRAGFLWLRVLSDRSRNFDFSSPLSTSTGRSRLPGPATKDSAMVSKKGSKGNPKPKGGFDSVTIASAGMM